MCIFKSTPNWLQAVDEANGNFAERKIRFALEFGRVNKLGKLKEVNLKILCVCC